MSNAVPAKPRPEPRVSLDDRTLFRLVIAAWAVAAVWKLVLAFTANVTLSEAEFAVLGRHPALVYPGMPGGWPLLAFACTRLIGWSAAAIRVPGLVLALTFAPAVYWLARARGTQREALWAAIVALLIPPFSLFGVVFGPSEFVPMALAVALGAAMRARQANRPVPTAGYWALAGVALALGAFASGRWLTSLEGWVLTLVTAALIAFVPFSPAIIAEDSRLGGEGRLRTVSMSAVVIAGVLIAVAATAFVEAWAHADKLPPSARPLLVGAYENWDRLTPPIDQAVDFARARFPGPAPVIVAPDRATALRLDFPGHERRDVLSLDTGLTGSAGLAAVLVAPSGGKIDAATAKAFCRRFEAIRPAGFSSLPPRRVTVRFYTARALAAPLAEAPPDCPLLR